MVLRKNGSNRNNNSKSGKNTDSSNQNSYDSSNNSKTTIVVRILSNVGIILPK